MEKQLRQELRTRLEKDIVERTVIPAVQRVVREQRAKTGVRAAPTTVDGHAESTPDGLDSKYLDRTGLRGLSFRPQKKRLREEIPTAVSTDSIALPERLEDGAEEPMVERPKKKVKKSKTKADELFREFVQVE